MKRKIEIERFGFENYLSFKDYQEFAIDKSGGFYRIIGRNDDYDKSKIDDEDVFANNGSGKSAFASVILYAIYGNIPKKVTKQKIINRYSNGGLYVMVEFKIENDVYKIERYRGHRKHKNKIYFTMNDTDLTKSDDEFTQEEILRVIGISYHTACRAFILSRSGYTNFFDLKPEDKSKLLDNLVRADGFARYAKLVKDKRREIRKEFDSYKSAYHEAAASHTTLQNVIGKSVKDYRLKRIDIKNDYAKSERIIKAFCQKYSVLESDISIFIDNELEKIRTSITDINNAEITKKNIKENRNHIRQVINQLRNYKKEIIKIEKQIGEVSDRIKEKHSTSSELIVACKKCGTVMDDSQFKYIISELEKEKDRKINSLKKMSEDFVAANADFLSKWKNRQRVVLIENLDKDSLEKTQSLFRKVQAVYSDYLSGKNKSDSIRSNVKNLIRENKSLYKESKSNMIHFQTKRDEAQHQLDIAEFMDYAFDFQNENSIKEYMLKNIVPLINQLVDYACQHIYQGQLYLVFDDFFSARIIYKGKEVTFEEFSDGEKARLNLIMNFVLFMIIRTMVADLNVMFLDEVFTFMDAFFIGKFVDYIKLVAPSDVSIYIISHESGMDTMLRPKKTILIKKKYDTSVVCDA